MRRGLRVLSRFHGLLAKITSNTKPHNFCKTRTRSTPTLRSRAIYGACSLRRCNRTLNWASVLPRDTTGPENPAEKRPLTANYGHLRSAAAERYCGRRAPVEASDAAAEVAKDEHTRELRRRGDLAGLKSRDHEYGAGRSTEQAGRAQY